MYNPGNMCYANSLFQAILIDVIDIWELSLSHLKNNKKSTCNCVGCVLRQTVKIYKQNMNCFNPSIYHNWIKNNFHSSNVPNAQEDVHELMKHIFSELSTANQRPCASDFTTIIDLFKGVSSVNITCSSCTTTKKFYNNFSELILNVTLIQSNRETCNIRL